MPPAVLASHTSPSLGRVWLWPHFLEEEMRLGEGPGELTQGSGVRARGAHTGVRASTLLHAAALSAGGLGGSLSPCPG